MKKKNGKKKNKTKNKSLLQVVQLSVLAVQAAAGVHLSKYITVMFYMFCKQQNIRNKNVLLTNY